MRVCSFVRFLLSSIQLLQLTYQWYGVIKFSFYSFHIIYILCADVVVVVVVVQVFLHK
jgi:hypothetical protein